MSAKENPVVGAMVRKDGKLQPIEGRDPSSQWTYREEGPAIVADAEKPPQPSS